MSISGHTSPASVRLLRSLSSSGRHAASALVGDGARDAASAAADRTDWTALSHGAGERRDGDWQGTRGSGAAWRGAAVQANHLSSATQLRLNEDGTAKSFDLLRERVRTTDMETLFLDNADEMLWRRRAGSAAASPGCRRAHA